MCPIGRETSDTQPMNANEDTGPGPGRLTPYTRLDEVLAGHASTLRSVLGDTFVGLYPLG